VWTVLTLRRSEEKLHLATQDLAASEQMFRTSFENAFVGMAYLDPDGRWTRANSRFCDLLGYELAGILGRPLDEAVHPEHLVELREQLRALREGRTDLHKCVERWRHREGSVLWFDFRVTALRNPRGEFRHFIFVLQDVTEARRAAEQLRILVTKAQDMVSEREALLRAALEDRSRAIEATRARDALLAIVSHELRSPLNSIRLWASLLQSDAKPDADMVQRAVQQIESSVDAQSRLINDLLDASRIASGKLELERERIDLCAVAGEVVQEFLPTAEKQGVSLEIEGPEGVVVVHADRARLKQALCNLVENAIKFTPRGGRVEVVLEAGGPGIDLRVRDTGAGIEPDHLPRIFEQFWQAQTGTSSGHGGLGLGLHIVKHVVERHGGSVSAHSDGAGRGSTFSLRLPLVERTPRVEVAAATGLASTSSATDGDVLVVDDDPGTAEALALALRARGQDVRVAFDGESALAAIARRRPRVVVSDLMMPGVDGCEMLRRVREQEADGKTLRIRAIAITGRGSPSDRFSARRSGFDACLTKPVRVHELFQRIQEASTRSRSCDHANPSVLVLGGTGELSEHLREAGYAVVSVGRPRDVARAAAESVPDVLLVDLDAIQDDVRPEVRGLRENHLSLFVIGMARPRNERADRELFDVVLEKPVRFEDLARVLRQAQETRGG
jgi:PAS domain S-box-containing protein